MANNIAQPYMLHKALLATIIERWFHNISQVPGQARDR
jgi:hypothetical protein